MTSTMLRSFVKEALAIQIDHDTPPDYAMTKEATLRRFPGLQKRAWDAGELAGLGVLAAPSVANLAGHPMKEKHKDVAEVAGLGMLAAPYAHKMLAARSAGYAATPVAQKFTRVFGH